MYCTNCGKQIIANSKFCNHCGHESPAITRPKIKHVKPINKNLSFKIISLIIIFGIILFIAYAFLNSKGYITSRGFLSVGNNKSSLEQRYIKLVSLINKKNCTELYDNYISLNQKRGMSKEDYCKGNTSSEFVKQIPQINSITIRGNIGYIDRTLVGCLNDDCTNKKILRGYKKWVFENGNWYSSGESPLCIRETSYSKPPEFDRALSLLKQRLTDKFLEGNVTIDFSTINCVDIQYSSLQNEEGIFVLDKNNSNLDKLTIYVDNSYKIKDDILTAFLLAHELSHAQQFLENLASGSVSDCFEGEIRAFWSQMWFLASLNEAEASSLDARIASTNYQNNNPLLIAKTLAGFAATAGQTCGSNGSNTACNQKRTYDQITSMVKGSPYYQKECAGK
jgi:hypothetical protein